MNHYLYIAEDDQVMSALLSELAREAGFRVRCFFDGQQAYQAIINDPPDALLADLQMPGLGGLELIEQALLLEEDLPVAIITGYATIPDVIRAFSTGAAELVTKPFDNADVRSVLKKFQKILDRNRRFEALNLRLSSLDSNQAPPLAKSKAMTQTMQMLDRVVNLDTPVLLNGETGCGKGVIARSIHDNSERRKGPWFSVNCGAVAETLAESELFGHERGAFTGANARKRGVLELAHGGTLFLDEINSASPAVQTRLLDFVQDKTLRRVGGEQAISVDVRLIIASNQPLDDLVAKKLFRADLWYRLNVFPVQIPALRERREDIIPLAEYFLAQTAQELQRTVPHLIGSAEQLLLNYSWPGNVRELQNYMHRAVVLADENQVKIKHLPSSLSGSHADGVDINWGPDASLLEVELCWINSMISRCEGNKTEAARRLGIDVSTLHRKLRNPD